MLHTPQQALVPRILICGAGNVGASVARLSAERGWRVMAAVNRDGPKVGQDLGSLAGHEALRGVTVQDIEKTDLGAFGANVAIVAVSDLLEVTSALHRRLIDLGLNVICLGAESAFPAIVDPIYAREIGALAKKRGVTLMGCGLWDAYRIGALKVLSGPCTEMTAVRHQSVTDVNRFGAETARAVHVGQKVSELDTVQAAGGSIYRVFMAQAVAALGLTLRDLHEKVEAVTLDAPVACPALDVTVEPGQCVGKRTALRASTIEGVEATAAIDLRLIGEGEEEHIKWRIDGAPPVEMTLAGIDTGHATASSVVNRIPDVLVAPAGVVTSDQLPPMRGGNFEREPQLCG